MIISSGGDGWGVGLYCFPILLSRQPSARKHTIHSLIMCQTLHTKLALLFFFVVFFGTISGHIDKKPLKGEMVRKDSETEQVECKHTDIRMSC